MTVQVQKLDGRFVLVLSEEQMRAAGLAEGDAVSIQRAGEAEKARPVIRYATTEEVMQAYKETEPRWSYS